MRVLCSTRAVQGFRWSNLGDGAVFLATRVVIATPIGKVYVALISEAVADLLNVSNLQVAIVQILEFLHKYSVSCGFIRNIG